MKLLTNLPTKNQTDTGENITSFAEENNVDFDFSECLVLSVQQSDTQRYSVNKEINHRKAANTRTGEAAITAWFEFLIDK